MRRRMALFGVLGMLAVPCLARRTMTLEQLQKMLAGAEAQHRSDAALATQVYEVELNARLDEVALAPLLAESPGPLTKRALRAVADEAEFLPTAASQISTRPAPEIAVQRQMMSQTVHYAARTLHELPNFLATRQTDSYDDAPRAAMVGGWPVRDSFQYRQSYAVPITYRDGHEINAAASGKLEKAAAKKAHKATEQDAELTSWGEFGPVLEIVLLDASKGKLGWSHWEERDGKPVAVFHFSIPQAVSHYNVRYDERLSPNEERAKGKQIVHIAAPYHGELAVDPETGAVQRVAIEAEMPASAAQSKAGMMVEYAPVRMGDTTCMCPAHSVVIAEIQDLYQPNGRSAIERIVDRMVNDVRYTNYRRFGSDVQLVMRADAGTQAAPAPASAKTEDEAAAAPPAAESAPGVAQGGGSSVVAAAPAVAAVEAPAAVAPAPAESDEEAIVRDVAEMPGMSAGDDAAKPSSGGFTLQVETRLVDMGVVVTDKHGKPVTDLRPEEIAIYDNGRLQKVAAFHHGDAAAVIPEQPAAEEGSYTNDRLGAAQAEGLPELMVLLVDEGHLPFNDLNRARGEVEKFLESAKPGSRLALYAVGEHGFHALQDVTTDRALVEAKLKAWRPNAAEVSLAQEQEVRNRQQFDYVR
ncbi:MAG TPA: VWA domain-containing protein, partial [Acidobacteriaceae bacterium]|nr:VWA domain-containing protein [Acidobacteriaceae bacterium]